MGQVHLALIILAVSCTPSSTRVHEPKAEPVWLSPLLKVPGNADFEAALAAPFDNAVSVVGQADSSVLDTVKSCRDYLRLRARGYNATTDEGHDLLRQEGVRCVAITQAARMKPGKGDPVRALLSGPQVLEHLPATLGPSSSEFRIAKRADAAARGLSWKAFEPAIKAEIKDGVLVVSEPDTVTELTPLAAGDLNSDGVRDLVLRDYGYGTEGNWLDVRLVVLALRSARQVGWRSLRRHRADKTISYAQPLPSLLLLLRRPEE